MVYVTLSEKEKEGLEERHKACRDKTECDRIKAILLSDEGWSTPMIAQALRKHETSILRHLKDYEQEQKLTLACGGSQSYLTDAQTKKLIDHLTQITYTSTQQIVAYVQKTYEI